MQRRGYVRQARKQGDYVLTTKVVSLGLGYLSNAGIVDIAEPIVERLAHKSVNCSPVHRGRRPPDLGGEITRRTPGGPAVRPRHGRRGAAFLHVFGARLAADPERRARARTGEPPGFGLPKDYGPKAPTTVKELLAILHAARECGYAMIDEVFAPGMAAMAAPVLRRKEAIGVLSIAGPRTRLTTARMKELAPVLLDAAAELGPISNASSLFGATPRWAKGDAYKLEVVVDRDGRVVAELLALVDRFEGAPSRPWPAVARW